MSTCSCAIRKLKPSHHTNVKKHHRSTKQITIAPLTKVLSIRPPNHHRSTSQTILLTWSQWGLRSFSLLLHLVAGLTSIPHLQLPAINLMTLLLPWSNLSTSIPYASCYRTQPHSPLQIQRCSPSPWIVFWIPSIHPVQINLIPKSCILIQVALILTRLTWWRLNRPLPHMTSLTHLGAVAVKVMWTVMM